MTVNFCSIKSLVFSGMVALSLLLSSSLFAQHSSKTIVQYLSGRDKDHTVNWDFYCSSGRKSGKWTTIPVPSCWEFHGFGSYNYGWDKNKADETGTYKHKFSLESKYKNQHVFIVFEGSMTDTEVKINGKLAGPIHQGAFYRFKYDITPHVKVGSENSLEVTVSKKSADPSVNRAERDGDLWVFGGIFRPVYLEILPETFIDRIALDAKANGALKVNVFNVNGVAGQQIQAEVLDMKGARVGNTFTALYSLKDSTVLQQNFSGVTAWNPEQPVLYNLHISILNKGNVVHQVTQRFGFRTVEVRKKDGIYVNNKKVIFKGVNRHCEWPESGRTLSKAIDLQDVRLIKGMNMNAVRMSHYPPDQSFLDLCDSLGLFVLDELTGWQAKYDTPVGRKLVKELVVRDVNHPSIILWDNGNEGGWNTNLDKDYAIYDPQARMVIHPWERKDGLDTKHYPIYNYVVNERIYENDIFFPTEFMHGLYDGGHGAGLDDFWTEMMKNPRCAGGFLWVFADGAIVRTDKKDSLDADANHAPDGILGPHREKEASFYTIKEIWSPVYISTSVLPQDFSGRLNLENRYIYSNLNKCVFKWKLVGFPLAGDKSRNTKIIAEASIKGLNLSAGESGSIQLNIPSNWRQADALLISVFDEHGEEILNKSWPISSPETIALKNITASKKTGVSVKNTSAELLVSCDGIEYNFSTASGSLQNIKNGPDVISLSDGPIQTGKQVTLKELRHYKEASSYIVSPQYSDSTFKVKWIFSPGLPVKLTYSYMPNDNSDFNGITFNYPEEKITGMNWLGMGPYRVWKNRLKGTSLNVWNKNYNNSITGETWNYPEFKGYHAGLYWVNIENKEHPFTIYTENENLYLQMLRPQKPKGATNNNTSPAFPEGNIGFLNGISAIGTKFNPAEDMGPESQKNMRLNYTPKSGVLWFDFR